LNLAERIPSTGAHSAVCLFKVVQSASLTRHARPKTEGQPALRRLSRRQNMPVVRYSLLIDSVVPFHGCVQPELLEKPGFR